MTIRAPSGESFSHLNSLEAESIQIIREVVAEFERPTMLYSIGKDSSVLLRLATLRKVSPLATWTMRDVEAYARIYEIPLLPLYQRGYTSIGCEPCTQLPIDPLNARSGRWLGQKIECGIHIERPGDV